MRLVVQEDADSVGEWVAHYVQERIRRFKPTAERPFVLGESGLGWMCLQRLTPAASPANGCSRDDC